MSTQLGFHFDRVMAARLQEFHEANPRVYSTLRMLAFQWIERTGRHKLGIATLFERTRWEIALSTSDPDFKLNNDFRAFYSRLLMLREPELAGLFDVRASAADEWIEAVA
jgi:hypothetical protein